jgi:hypothetical protein
VPVGDVDGFPGAQLGDTGIHDNPDGGATRLNPDGTTSTEEPAGPDPIDDWTPHAGPQPIDDSTPHAGPQPIGPTTAPGSDTPGSDSPASDTPGSDTPGSDTPASDTPGSDTPGSAEPAAPSTGTTTIAGDGTVTAVDGDGNTNVSSTLPPADTGPFSTGPGATDPHDPQQGQQPIGFTHNVLGPTSPSDPTTSISDMPNTAHVLAPGETPGQAPTSTTGSTYPHKPTTP